MVAFANSVLQTTLAVTVSCLGIKHLHKTVRRTRSLAKFMVCRERVTSTLNASLLQLKRSTPAGHFPDCWPTELFWSSRAGLLLRMRRAVRSDSESGGWSLRNPHIFQTELESGDDWLPVKPGVWSTRSVPRTLVVSFCTAAQELSHFLFQRWFTGQHLLLSEDSTASCGRWSWSPVLEWPVKHCQVNSLNRAPATGHNCVRDFQACVRWVYEILT